MRGKDKEFVVITKIRNENVAHFVRKYTVYEIFSIIFHEIKKKFEKWATCIKIIQQIYSINKEVYI